MSRSYPNITSEEVTRISVALIQTVADPTYLTQPECPYKPPVKALVMNLLSNLKSQIEKIVAPATQPRPETVKVATSADVLDFAMREVLVLFNDVQSLADVIDRSSPKQLMDYIALRTKMVDKLAGMNRVKFEVEQLRLFKSEVLNILTEILSDDQQLLFISKLERAGDRPSSSQAMKVCTDEITEISPRLLSVISQAENSAGV